MDSLTKPCSKRNRLFISLKKKNPTAAHVLNGVISQGFARERQQAGVHFSELAKSLCLHARRPEIHTRQLFIKQLSYHHAGKDALDAFAASLARS